jgi:UDP-N-acetylglucosamine 2-epimerase
VIQHPVTTGTDNRANLQATFEAVAATEMPTIWFWPNPDAGTGEMAEMLRHLREAHVTATERMRFITNLPQDEFIALLRRTACLVGNSSAGIKECSFLGTPVVNIGVRQHGRLNADNVQHVDAHAPQICEAIQAQLGHGRYRPSNIYYQSGASDRMVDVLSAIDLYTQKRFFDAEAAVTTG